MRAMNIAPFSTCAAGGGADFGASASGTSLPRAPIAYIQYGFFFGLSETETHAGAARRTQVSMQPSMSRAVRSGEVALLAAAAAILLAIGEMKEI